MAVRACPLAQPRDRVAVAFSGGRDSLALLHVSCRVACALGLEVVAIHVHHGLMPEADAWLHAARRLVRRWRRSGWPIVLVDARLEGKPAPGQSIEAWARIGRHGALQRLAREAGASLLLLAHHRGDQAETVLLQALRGAGPAGLAAMPAAAWRDGLRWARPWLQQPRRAIEAYVRRHRLRPLEDPSNQDPRFARNRLRGQVWPALVQAFPDAEASLAAVARRAQQADTALEELATLDLAACTTAGGDRLRVAAWRGLSPARQANALQAWWWRRTGRGAPHTLVQRLLAELPEPDANDHSAGQHAPRRWPAVDGDEPVFKRGLLDILPVVSPRPSMPAGAMPEAIQLNLASAGRHAVSAWGGAFVVEACTAQGLPAALLRAVQLRRRSGGEQFQVAPGRPPRLLKKQFQAMAVPAGPLRDGPLLWHGDQLLFVPGLGVDARCWAAAATPQWRLRWLPDAWGPEARPDSAAGQAGLSVPVGLAE